MNFFVKNKAFILLAIGIIGVVVINWNKLKQDDMEEATPYSEALLTTTNHDMNLDYIMVDIKGEVFHPGLYEVLSDQRIGDVINIAGGVTLDADISGINLAKKVEDEMVIVIPKNTDNNLIIPDDIVKIIVEIKGEVQSPGIYEMYQNQRVSDLIELAGGLTGNADISSISMVEILEDEAVIVIPSKSYETPISEELITVEIKGEINRPSIYQITAGSRVQDLIDLAGGVTENADIESIEAARLLLDGESVMIKARPKNDLTMFYVQILGEVLHPGTYLITEENTLLDLITLAGGVTPDCDLSKINWNIRLCLGAVIYIPSYDDEVDIEEENGLININTADLETLMTLTGIGQILGQRIIDHRAEYGDFLSIEDIMNVSGIKESIYEQIKENITV